LYKQKQNGNLISKSRSNFDKSFAQEKGSKKLLAECLAFSVLVIKDKKYHNTGNAVH